MSQSETPQVDAESEDMNIHALCGSAADHMEKVATEAARLRAELAEANAEVKYQRAMRNDALNLYDAAQAEVTRLMHLVNGYVAENERLTLDLSLATSRALRLDTTRAAQLEAEHSENERLKAFLADERKEREIQQCRASSAEAEREVQREAREKAGKELAAAREEIAETRVEFLRFLSVCAEGGRNGRPMDLIPKVEWERARAFLKEPQ